MLNRGYDLMFCHDCPNISSLHGSPAARHLLHDFVIGLVTNSQKMAVCIGRRLSSIVLHVYAEIGSCSSHVGQKEEIKQKTRLSLEKGAFLTMLQFSMNTTLFVERGTVSASKDVTSPQVSLALVITSERANANREIRLFASTTPSAYFLFPSEDHIPTHSNRSAA